MHKKNHKQSLFPSKINSILSDQELHRYINWGEEVGTIEIPDIKAFEQNVLTKYFRHQNFDSFSRQMNLYGFKKNRNSFIQIFTNKDLLNSQNLKSLRSKNQKQREKHQKQTELMEELQKQNVVEKEVKLNGLKGQKSEKKQKSSGLSEKNNMNMYGAHAQQRQEQQQSSIRNGFSSTTQYFTYWPMNCLPSEMAYSYGWQYMFSNSQR